MHAGKANFSRLTDWIHPEQFRRCVQRYDGDHRVHNFSCWDQFLATTFAQLNYRESLADIEVCLRSRHDQLYRLGFRSTLAHSTLADANRERDWRIYAALAQRLIAQARRLYADEPLGVELDQTVYALDSSTIDLCLSLFPWARFRTTKAAIKLRTLSPRPRTQHSGHADDVFFRAFKQRGQIVLVQLKHPHRADRSFRFILSAGDVGFGGIRHDIGQAHDGADPLERLAPIGLMMLPDGFKNIIGQAPAGKQPAANFGVAETKGQLLGFQKCVAAVSGLFHQRHVIGAFRQRKHDLADVMEQPGGESHALVFLDSLRDCTRAHTRYRRMAPEPVHVDAASTFR
jgi:hypothetical protein